MIKSVEVLYHSSIRIACDKVIYIDPYKINEERHDADIIYITHEHYDHFSPVDIKRVQKSNTVIVFPEAMQKKISELGLKEQRSVKSGEAVDVCGIKTEGVAAYNLLKPFHPKSMGWLGYVLTIEDKRIFIAGDTDINNENKRVKCDIALVPVGGTFTMDAKKAAELVNIIKPAVAIPVHYGSVVGSREDAKAFVQYVDKQTEVRL